MNYSNFHMVYKQICLWFACFLLSLNVAHSQTSSGTKQLWVGEKFQMAVADVADRSMLYQKMDWTVSGGLSTSYNGNYAYTVYFDHYVSGTASVYLTWQEYSSPFDGLYYNRYHTWYFTCRDNPITLDKYNITISGNQTATINYYFYDSSHASNANVTFSSSNTNVAKVNYNGVVTPVSKGTATITVKSSVSSESKTCTVTVTSDPISIIKVTSISLNPSSFTLLEGDDQQITATVYPSNATNKSVTWSSDDTSVATVNNSGYVTAKSAGTATITCRATDGSGVSATCDVVVYNPLQDGDVFKEYNEDGIEIAYQVISASGKKCEVYATDYYNPAISLKTSGRLIIPNKAHGYSVTSIGEYAFSNCYNLTSVTIPNSVTSIGGEAFQNCSLTSVTIPNSVTSIGEYAFRSCSGLTSVTIPNSVTAIGEEAFYGCRSLTSVTIPNSVTAIGEKAFYGCRSLTSIIIPNSVTAIGEKAFYQCSSLTSVTIPNSVISIGEEAFDSCSGLTSVTIPNSVTSIGNYAFYDCSSLTSVTIPNSVTSIGDGVFSGCSGLTSVTIPNSVTSIGESAFWGCSDLTSVTIPYSVTSFGNNAFRKCSGLTSVTIPNSVTSIGKSAFYGCSGLTSIVVEEGNKFYDSRMDCNAIIKTESNELVVGCKNTVIPNSVTSIGYMAFPECSSLTSITIPNSVTSIEQWAFYHCSGLTSITIPNSVTSIGIGAFVHCSSLTSVTIPNSVTNIGASAFYHCSSLTSVTIPNSVTSIGKDAFDETGIYTNSPNGVFYVDKWACGYKGTMPSNTVISLQEGTLKIADEAFYYCSNLTGVIIPNSVKSIGKDAFDETGIYTNSPNGVFYVDKWACGYKGRMPSNTVISLQKETVGIANKAFSGYSSMTSVTIPNSVTSIGEEAFYSCSGLTSVTIPNSVTNIGRKAFYGCRGLTSVTIPNSVASIEDGVFLGCSSLTSVAIPNGVTSIGEKAFYSCSGLTSVSIPNSVTSIGNYAFDGCRGLTSVTIPNSVASIEDGVFYNCSSLTSVTIPNSVISIGEEAFRYCYGLTSLTIPNSVTSIGRKAFYGCRGLMSVTIPSSVISIGEEAFYSCSGLTSVTIPNSVASIEDGVFSDCSSLMSVTIPNSVISIGEEAFRYCYGLTSVTIPNSVTSIGDYAFQYCHSLTSVVSGIETPFAFGKSSFEYIASNCTLTFPAGTKDAYIASGWTEDVFMGGIMEKEAVTRPTDISQLTDALYAEPSTGKKGGEATLTISLKNAQATNAYSFDLVLPDGVTLATDGEGEYLYEQSTRHNGHSATINRNETTGVYSFAVLSLASKEVKGNDGAIWTLPLNVAEGVEVGEYAVKIQNAKYSLVSGASKVSMPETTSLLVIEDYIKGDVNNDGEVDIADAVCIVNYVVGKETPVFVMKAADVNGDGEVDIADAVRIVNLVVGKIDALARKRTWNLPEPQ